MKKTLILVVAIVVLAAIALTYFSLRKTFTVEIVHADGTVKTLEMKSCKKDLFAVLADKDLVKIEKTADYAIIKEVDGEEAEFKEGSCWYLFIKSDSDTIYGAEEIPIRNGEAYRFVFVDNIFSSAISQ